MQQVASAARNGVTAAPFMLGTATRLAPDELFADEAFALPESHEGSDSPELPPGDAQLLEDLEPLVEPR